MRIKSAAIGAAALAMATVMPVQAELLEGDQEIAGSLSIQDSDSSESTMLLVTYGRMMNANLQANAGIFLLGSEDFTTGQVTFGADYLFSPRAEVIPYAGGSYAMAVGDFDDTDFLQLKAGAKTFISETTSVYGEIRRLEPIDTDFSSITTLAVGLAVKF